MVISLATRKRLTFQPTSLLASIRRVRQVACYYYRAYRAYKD
jgi:hypothetical protein